MEDQYEELEKDFSKWGDKILREFEQEFKARYPELAEDLVYDEKQGMWKVRGPEHQDAF